MVSIEHLETPAFLVDVLPDGSFVYRNGNGPLSDRTGLGQRLVAGRSPCDLLPAHFAATVIAHYEACVQSFTVLSFEEQFDCDGQSTHWRTTLIPIKEGEERRVTALLGIMVDITASKRIELERMRANARLSLALQAVQGAHWEYDVLRHRFEASPALAVLLGERTPRAIQLGDWVRAIPAGDRPAASFHALVEGSCEEQVARFRIVTGGGQERWLKCRRIAVRDLDRGVHIIFGVTVDVSDEVHAEQRLLREAHQDGLTRLLNRRGFLARLEALTATEAGQPAKPFVVAMLDLDRFKAINDTLGHAAGDAVLIHVGQQIEALLRGEDFAARLGGDEFAVALRGRDPVRVRLLLERLQRRLNGVCPYRGVDIPVAVSIGHTVGMPGQTVPELMELADNGLYADKNRRRECPSTADAYRRSA